MSGCIPLTGQARRSSAHGRGAGGLHWGEESATLCGPYRDGRIVELLALGVAISNADWRERVGEAGGERSSSSLAVSISSPAGGGGITVSAEVERLRAGGDGRESQSL